MTKVVIDFSLKTTIQINIQTISCICQSHYGLLNPSQKVVVLLVQQSMYKEQSTNACSLAEQRHYSAQFMKEKSGISQTKK